MRTSNFKIKKNTVITLNLFDILLFSIIALTILSAIIVWNWYGYKDALIENEILHLKY